MSSRITEGLRSVHAALAPNVVKRLAMEYRGDGTFSTPSAHLTHAMLAQSAEEAAFHVQRAGLARRDMRNIVAGHIHRESTERFGAIVALSKDKSAAGTEQTDRHIVAYTTFRRDQRGFFSPNMLERTLDTIASLIPSTQLANQN